jgi:hypothetical protein
MSKAMLQALAKAVLSGPNGYTIELKQQSGNGSMKYLVRLQVPDGKWVSVIGKWNGGNKKEAIKQAKIYSEKYGWYNQNDELVPAPIEYNFLEKKK